MMAMLAAVLHPLDHGARVARRHGIRRSPHWSAARRAHLKDHPVCELCGCKASIEVHHRFPFHLAKLLHRDDLELAQRNLITLCDCHEHQHHLLLGHWDDFESYNLEIGTYRDPRTSEQIRADAGWKFGVKCRPPPWRHMSEDYRTVLRALVDSKFPKEKA